MIQEDPDELGYWIGGDPHVPPMATDSLAVCNAILADHERADIEHAARLAYAGLDTLAERTRRYADYHNLGFRADADRVIR